MITRRRLLSLASLAAPVGLVVPRRLMALDSATDRKFLFIYAYGGWDPIMCFAPMFGQPNIDCESDAVASEANGITFVDHEDRPSVRSFFETYGDRACVINGIEVRSVTHERCQRMIFTGGGESTTDDWGVITASNAMNYYPVPHLVLAGPAFSGTYAANVVRAGEVGQLTELLSGDALTRSTLPVSGPSASGDALEDAFLKSRIDAYAAVAARGSPRRMAELYASAMENLAELTALGDTVDLNPTSGGCRRDIAADAACVFNAFEIGLSRCAITKDNGWCSMSWDSHADNELQQGRSFEEMFGFLNELMADLDSRTGLSGNPLRDEVTIVVFSEMGRHPQLSGGGRAHWTYTSAMLIGSGVKGGQVIGQMDSNYQGMPVNLDSGQVDETGGDSLLPGHLGATILELAGVDYSEFITQGRPIKAAIDS